MEKISVTADSGNKCDLCRSSLCCQYTTQQVDRPTSIEDFDLLLWQLSHKNVHLFKDEQGWFLLFMSPCVHLQADGRCGIYTTRPLICRDHSNDYCEMDVSIPAGSDLYFDSYSALDTYCRKRFKTWDKRFEKKQWKRNA